MRMGRPPGRGCACHGSVPGEDRGMRGASRGTGASRRTNPSYETLVPARSEMSTDAIVLLKDEHKQIKKAFRDFEKTGEKAYAAKGKAVTRMIELLTAHTYIENEV